MSYVTVKVDFARSFKPTEHRPCRPHQQRGIFHVPDLPNSGDPISYEQKVRRLLTSDTSTSGEEVTMAGLEGSLAARHIEILLIACGVLLLVATLGVVLYLGVKGLPTRSPALESDNRDHTWKYWEHRNNTHTFATYVSEPAALRRRSVPSSKALRNSDGSPRRKLTDTLAPRARRECGSGSNVSWETG
jgi:hypothetical protein